MEKRTLTPAFLLSCWERCTPDSAGMHGLYLPCAGRGRGAPLGHRRPPPPSPVKDSASVPFLYAVCVQPLLELSLKKKKISDPF